MVLLPFLRSFGPAAAVQKQLPNRACSLSRTHRLEEAAAALATPCVVIPSGAPSGPDAWCFLRTGGLGGVMSSQLDSDVAAAPGPVPGAAGALVPNWSTAAAAAAAGALLLRAAAANSSKHTSPSSCQGRERGGEAGDGKALQSWPNYCKCKWPASSSRQYGAGSSDKWPLTASSCF